MTVRYFLQGIHFEWDAKKATANRRKHGVAFEHACETFFDPFLCALEQSEGGGEGREAILGLTTGWKLLHVAFVERGDAFRIISARRATHAERRAYEGE